MKRAISRRANSLQQRLGSFPTEGTSRQIEVGDEVHSLALSTWLRRLAPLLLLAGCSPGAATGPSVLLVSIDTLRADHLGCYGYGRGTSPCIDALAGEGARFAEMHASASKTAESHASMFTGMYPTVHGVKNFEGRLGTAPSEDLPMLAEVFRDAGYETAAFTGGGMMSGELGFARGFDTFDDRGGGADRVFARSAEWLRARGGSARPFFLLAHNYEVHDPYTPPPEWQARFVDPHYAGGIDSTRVEWPLDWNEAFKLDRTEMHAAWGHFWEDFDYENDADRRHVVDLYDAGVAYTDHLLGAFWDECRALGVDEEAWLVIVSDHGEGLGQHRVMTHNSAYQEVLHVPLLVRPPGGAEATVVDAPVRGVDLAPSVAALAGLALPIPVQGRSWAGLAGGAGSEWDDMIFAEHFSPWQAQGVVRRGALKVLRDRESGAVELYALGADPAELEDRYAVEPERAAVLLEELDAHERESAALSERFPPVQAVLGAATAAELDALGYTGRDDDPDDRH